MWRQGRSTRGDQRNPRPRWWLLYVIGALMMTMIGLVEILVDAEGPRRVFETLAVVAGFGLTRIWVRFNRIALELQQGRRHA